MKPLKQRLIPAMLLLAFSGSASASAFQLWEQNASGLGTAYAGSAAIADNASTVFFNPAGMTQLGGSQLSLGVTAVKPNFEFTNDGSSGLLGTGDGGNAGDLAAVPNAYFSLQLTPKLFLGFGISAPFGLATEYESASWMGSYQAVKSEIITVNFNPSIAYKVSDKVSLGLGLNYQTIEAEMTSATPRGLYRVEGDDAAWGWNVGALFTLSPTMRVGLSYRSAVDYTLEGTRAVGALSSSAKADIELPDTFTISTWQQVSDRWEAMGDLSYTHWSTLDQLSIQHAGGTDVEPFKYKDSWRIAWGVAYKVSDAAKLKFGLAYDRTPTTDNDRSARVPDNNRVWFSLGAQYNAGKIGRFDVGYAYLYLEDPIINQSKFNGASKLSGSYENSGHVLGAQYSLGF
ncbi:MAG: outer membrane protein transport protein [Rhodocyclaceae bacterium]|nr:outer membrane protein transport protein [Rhodocyclaceae bacterium]